MEPQEAQQVRHSATYRAHGLVLSWQRVWDEDDGRDITAAPLSTWSWPYSEYVSGKRG